MIRSGHITVGGFVHGCNATPRYASAVSET